MMSFAFRTPALRFFHPATLIATWFGAGLVPKAAGTVGSLATLPFAWVIDRYAGMGGLLLFALISFIIGWWATHIYMQHGKVHDPNEVVIDEVAGQALLLAFLPHTLAAYVIGFFLFRLFDIVKPWPVCIADRQMESAFGVMLDDILAALYPVLILYGLIIGAGMIGSTLPDAIHWMRYPYVFS